MEIATKKPATMTLEEMQKEIAELQALYAKMNVRHVNLVREFVARGCTKKDGCWVAPGA